MRDRFLDRPILNSPYEYPSQHWKVDESGQPTSRILDRRRRVSFITPIPKPKKRGQRALVFDEAAQALEEAVRIGNRIAIMHSGRIVQIGTAEDIVMHPADDYVADFVAGISRLKVVHAHAVMQPLRAYERESGPLAADAPGFREDVSLSALIHTAIESDSPIAVTDQSGARIGVITRADLLKTIVEGSDHLESSGCNDGRIRIVRRNRGRRLPDRELRRVERGLLCAAVPARRQQVGLHMDLQCGRRVARAGVVRHARHLERR